MVVPLPLLFLAGLAVLVLALLAIRPRGRSDDLIAVPRPKSRPPARRGAVPNGQMLELPAETRLQAEQLVADGNVIQAITLYRDTTGSRLKDAKDAVDAMRRSVSSSR